MSALTEPACIVDGHHGIYVPQVWAERYDVQAVEAAGVRAGHIMALALGPDVDDYWESWASVLDAYCHEVDGVKHYLIQDGDLFEYPETCCMDDFWN